MKVDNCILLSLCSLLILGVISSCAATPNPSDIFDDDTEISQEGDSYTYDSRLGGVEPGNQMDTTYEGFSGCETIWDLQTMGAAEVTFSLDSQVESGDFKVVLISPEKEVETILSGTGQNKVTLELAVGKYILKIVGRKASGQIKIAIESNKDIVITGISESK